MIKKTKITLIVMLLMTSLAVQAQTMMNIHQSNGTVLQIPLNTIDSITYTMPNFGAGVTFDGYTYTSILIGNGQEWMAENLRTTTYANGDPIPNVTDSTQWQNLTTGAWAHYNNDSQYENPYGKLYNWYTVADPRNVCPTGWHVPTDAEYTLLSNYLGGEPVAGGKMKSTGTQYWQNPNTAATNESGFSGLPGGFRGGNGESGSVGGSAVWWSSTEFVPLLFPWWRSLDYNNGGLTRGYEEKQWGFSIRCLRD